jgi:hypothetical protein
MTVSNWFSMLSKERQEDSTYVYEVNASAKFKFNDFEQEPGQYFIRASKENVDYLKGKCKVTKLSFSKIVYLSDLFSMPKLYAETKEKELPKAAQEGTASKYLEDIFGSPLGLQQMRDRTDEKYFKKGLKGLILRFFSAIANFFRKYNLYLTTGIYWPGNSCAYAKKVIDKLNRVNGEMVKLAIQLSAEILSKEFNISYEEMIKMPFSEVKRHYKKKALLFHPDKQLTPEVQQEAAEKFRKINRIYRDFENLLLFKDKSGLDISIKSEDKKSPSTNKEPFPFRVAPALLALPAPV